MKKDFLLIVLQLFYCCCFSQYIGVKAKYTDSHTVPNPPYNDSREDRLVLSFYSVDPFTFEWTPISVSNYDMYVKEGGIQIGGGPALDSVDNNYPGYTWTAPVVASYYNSIGRSTWDCSGYGVHHYVANGHELDCGFLMVSQWIDDGLGGSVEQFTTIEVGLPYYIWPDQYYLLPGNVNFGEPGFFPQFPYNRYNFSCGGPLQLIVRGPMVQDTSNSLVPLAVRFSNLSANLQDSCKPLVKFSNLTESDIRYYIIEKTMSNGLFVAVDSLLPTANNGGAVNYSWQDTVSVNGFNLYRIKAVENTGRYYYSMVLRVNGCGGRGSANNNDLSKIKVYPNPLQNGKFYLNVTDLPAGRYSITLVSALGQQRKVTEFDHNGGSLNKLFDLGWIPQGLYTLALRSDAILLAQKIIIRD